MHEVGGNKFAYRAGSERPWHVDEGGPRDNPVPDADCFSFEAFMAAAHMDLTYEKVPVRLDNDLAAERVPGLFAMLRSDGHIIPNTGVGSQYDVLQPREAFAFFQPFLENKSVILDTAAVLRSGSRFFINGAVQTDGTAEILPSDSVRGNLLFYTSVDGSLVTGIGFTATRVVCANTLRIAQAESAPRLRVKHTKGQRATLEQIQSVLDFQRRSFAATVAQYRALTLALVPKADLERYVQIVLDFPKDKNGDLSTKASNIIGTITDLADTGHGSDLPGVRGTAWGAYNAVTEYLTHSAGRNEWTRQDSILFGEYAKTSARALEVATKMFVPVAA